MKHRKDIRLKNYDYKTNGYYFVTICTAMRRPWLEQYKTEVEILLKDTPKRFSGITIDFYSIASNHLHIIFVLNNAKARLGDIVRTFKALVTKSAGCKPFWEWNYYEHIIRDEKALYNIRKYIQENPLKEKIDWNNIYGGINATATTHCSGAIYRTNQGGAIYRTLEDAKGVALIIVIFAMMVFAVLGWTLANLQTGDFEANLRNFDSTQALSLAEAGSQWALNQLSQDSDWRTDANDNQICNAPDWLTHSLGPGQYRVCSRDPTAAESANADADVVVEARGFIPDPTNYRAMRQTKLMLSWGLTNAVQTQPSDASQPEKGLFDWWLSRSGHAGSGGTPPGLRVDGDISAGHYRGDNDTTNDQQGITIDDDYDPLPTPVSPDDGAGDQRDFSASFPAIDMQDFYNLASPANRWPNPSTRPITAIASDTSSDNILNGTSGFFTGMIGQAVRSIPHGWSDTPPFGWAVITDVQDGGATAILDRTIGNDWDNDDIRLVRRFPPPPPSYNNQGVYYVGGAIAGGTPADALIDLRNDEIDFRSAHIIAEGDIVIKGPNRIRMRFNAGRPRYPNLATKNGDIISTDTPAGGNENAKRNQRIFQGLIYSEFGWVNLNYLNGTLVYGDRITLDGRILIDYDTERIVNTGFKPASISWQEQ